MGPIPELCSVSIPELRSMSSRKRERELETELILPDWADELTTKGYMVVPNVVDPAECKVTQDMLFAWFENLGTGVDRSKPETFQAKNLPSSIRGIYQQYALGQSAAAWTIRQHPKVHEVFSKLLGSEDLVTSIDGVCVMPPPEARGVGFDNGKRWYHFDQGKTLGRRCVQGFVAVTESAAEDGTLVVLEGSHLYHSEFMTKFGAAHAKSGDWIKFNEEELKWLQDKPGVKEVRVAAPLGSLVLWDSRTGHCNAYAMANREHSDRFRMVVYCCQQQLPQVQKERNKMLAKKRKVFHENRVTSHWPLNSKVFPLRANFGKPASDFQQPQEPIYLSPLGQKLTGFRS